MIEWLEPQLTIGLTKNCHVQVCMDPDTRALYAVKTYSMRLSLSKLRTMINEVEISRQLNHPRLAKFVGVWVSLLGSIPDKIHVVFEYYEGGDLFHLFNYGPPILNRRFYVEQLVSALSYLHNRRILHGDIKPENIFIDGDGHVHLGDFGTTAHLPPDSDVLEGHRGGTLAYCSPQHVNREPYGLDCDIWAMGVVLYELFYERHPFFHESNSHMISRIRVGQCRFPTGLTVSEEEFLRRCLVVDRENRATIDDLKALPYFADTDWEAIPTAVPWRPAGEMCVENEILDLPTLRLVDPGNASVSLDDIEAEDVTLETFICGSASALPASPAPRS